MCHLYIFLFAHIWHCSQIARMHYLICFSDSLSILAVSLITKVRKYLHILFLIGVMFSGNTFYHPHTVSLNFERVFLYVLLCFYPGWCLSSGILWKLLIKSNSGCSLGCYDWWWCTVLCSINFELFGAS